MLRFTNGSMIGAIFDIRNCRLQIQQDGHIGYRRSQDPAESPGIYQLPVSCFIAEHRLRCEYLVAAVVREKVRGLLDISE